MKRRVALVTGAFGYVGGRLVRSLAEAGWTLRLGAHAASFARPPWLARAELVRLDVLSESSLASACRGAGAVVHLAALDENESARDPARAFAVNAEGTRRTLDAALRRGVERFVYLSTAHVYGRPLAGSLTEDRAPRPVHPYAVTHLLAEHLVLAAHARGEIRGIVLRLSNAFGPPGWPRMDRWSLLVNELCREAVRRRRLTLKTSGLQRRDFIPLEDVGRAAVHALALPGERLGDGLFNLGGKAPWRVLDVARRIARRCRRVLGFEPALLRARPKRGERSAPLAYSIRKLERTGFRLGGDPDAEIDGTLAFCRGLRSGVRA